MKFEFATANRILFGTGRISEIGDLARSFGQRALLVTGGSVSRAQGIMNALQAAGLSFTTHSVTGEPGVADVRAGAARTEL